MIKEYLVSLGYNNIDIEKILNAYSLNSLKENTLLIHIKEIYDLLISLGYSNENIIRMTNVLPALYSLSAENIKKKFDDLISLGYSYNDVIKMTIILPSLFGFSTENIRQKTIFLKQIDLDFIAVEDTKKLMQSIDLTYARYMFFKDRGIVINEENYRRLFYNAKQFEKQYGIDKSTLLEKYNYQKHMGERENDKRIFS